MAWEDLPGGIEPDLISGLGGFTKKGVANPTSITGYYYGPVQRPKKDKPGQYQLVHLFKTETKLVGIWGVGNMDEKLATAIRGMKLRVTFKESKATKNGGEFKIYSFQRDPADCVEPPVLPPLKESAPAAPLQRGPAKQQSDANEDVPF